MKKLLFKGASFFLAAIALANCNANKQTVGTGIGVVAGGLLGSQFGKGSGNIAATIAGAGIGAMIGGSIGQQLDEQDRRLMDISAQKALENAPSGSTVAWNNPDNGHAGDFTPVKTYQEKGRYCREYSQTIDVGGEAQKAYGKACRMPDGQWEIVK